MRAFNVTGGVSNTNKRNENGSVRTGQSELANRPPGELNPHRKRRFNKSGCNERISEACTGRVPGFSKSGVLTVCALFGISNLLAFTSHFSSIPAAHLFNNSIDRFGTRRIGWAETGHQGGGLENRCVTGVGPPPLHDAASVGRSLSYGPLPVPRWRLCVPQRRCGIKYVNPAKNSHCVEVPVSP
jgi:hypothetical protein